MSCGQGGCSDGASPFSPEYKRYWKPENNAGCCCTGSDRNKCDKPSLAKPGSPLAKWEAIHGKVITRVLFEQDAQGHPTVRIEKLVCPIPDDKPSRYGCCSLRYRVQR